MTDERNAAQPNCDAPFSGSVVGGSDHQTLDAGSPERSRKTPSSEASWRSKKAYAERWHKSVTKREQVCDVRGYRGEAREPVEPKGPAFHRPKERWTPQYPDVRPACFAGDFLYGLSGIDQLRVQNQRAREEGYAA
jgi:hypothetical protein